VVTQSYGYDALNRLTSASEGANWSRNYAYDRFGNGWVSGYSGITPSLLTPVAQSQVSATTNRIVLGGFAYDAAGNLTNDSTGAVMAYDGENRLKSHTNLGATTTYEYDGDGRRVKKAAGGVTTVFVYNAGGQLIAEYDSNAALPSAAGGTKYVSADHLGSTRVVVDGGGVVKGRHDYLPFGEEVGAGIGGRTTAMGYSANDSTRNRFTGKERDNESGLDFFEARYYSSPQGRFTSTDPSYFQVSMAIDPQRFNLYGYGRNNPLKWVDPNGERLFLRGDTAWLQTNVLYEMAGGQAEFDRYFEIQNGQVVLRAGVNTANLSSGLQQILDLVNATENYLYFAGDNGQQAADLFQNTRDNRGRPNDYGRRLSEEFTGSRNRQTAVGSLVGTNGRAGSPQPANLPNGDPVFAVIAINTRAEFTQSGLSFNFERTTQAAAMRVIQAQLDGLNQVIRPVSFFIHESAENQVFAQIGATNQNYHRAHSRAMEREAVIRRDLGITGGFAGGVVTRRVR
jgi:RHS repeat-associated protein